jgi:hypothetical protein
MLDLLGSVRMRAIAQHLRKHAKHLDLSRQSASNSEWSSEDELPLSELRAAKDRPEFDYEDIPLEKFRDSERCSRNLRQPWNEVMRYLLTVHFPIHQSQDPAKVLNCTL